MAKSYVGPVAKGLAWWVDMVRRAALWVVLLATFATGIVLHYAVYNLAIKTDTTDMLSDTLPFRRNCKDFKEAFPQFHDTMLLVVDGETSDLAQDASTTLANRLKRETHIFKTVYLPGGGRFFEEHGLLYLSPAKLEDLADNLAKIQPFLGKLTRDQSLKGLFSMLASAVDAVMEGEDLDLSTVFDRVSEAIEATVSQRRYELSWQELMSGRGSSPNERRRLIVLQPRLDYSKLLSAEAAMRAVRHLTEELHLTEDCGVRVRITGEVALQYEDLRSVGYGAGIAGMLALVLVGIILFAGLGSSRLVIATLVTLLMGLVWTAGFATVAVGHLNLISIAFAVLYIGLSVDYAIHFSLRYKELVRQGDTHPRALRQTAQDIGGSLAFCAITTATGFYAFIPTVFAGVAELGVISGTGMFISLIANLTVLPALLSLMPVSREASVRRGAPGRLGVLLFSLPSRHADAIRIGALALGVGAMFVLPHVSFDRNTLNLGNPESESVTTFTELLAQSKTSPWRLTVLTRNVETAREYAGLLDKMDTVDKTVTLEDFIPSEQDEKLAIIEEIALLIGPELLETIRQSPPSAADQKAAMAHLSASLARYLKANNDPALISSARHLRDSLGRFSATLNTKEDRAQAHMLRSLDVSLLSSLPGRLRTLQASLGADRVTRDDLPDDLVQRWVARDGRYRIEVFPRENVNDSAALRRFVATVQAVAPDATGFPVINLEAGDAVVRAFQQAFLWALVSITALLLILIRPRSDALLVLLPLLLAGALTAAASVLLDIPFNFANVIALPLLFGIGVDSGIHMVHRIRAGPRWSGQMLQTSTARAILYSGLTTMGSFGNLALSSHRGMASMGQLLTIGIGLTLMCTLVVLPACFKPGSQPTRSR